MIWTAFACLVFFVDSIVWSGNTINWSPTWCDISTHFLIGCNLAISAGSLCINRHLYQIASVCSVTKTRTEKRRAIMINLAIGLGLPLLQISLQYIDQGHRYSVFKDIGCMYETFETPVSIVLYHLPPIPVGCISVVYGSSGCVSPLSLHPVAETNHDSPHQVNVHVVGFMPWVSWTDTHSNFSRINAVPGAYWRADRTTVTMLETTRWFTLCVLWLCGRGDQELSLRVPECGEANGVLEHHVPLESDIFQWLELEIPPMSSTGRSSATFPVFICKDTTQKRDSFDCLSDMTASFAGLIYNASRADKSFGEQLTMPPPRMNTTAAPQD